MEQLTVENLSFAFGEKQILKGVSFSANSGEITALLGINGAGKTTLLKCVNDIYTPSGGQIQYNGKNLHHMSATERSKLIGYVPQSYIPQFEINVFDMVMMGRIPFLKFKIGQKDKEIVFDILERLKLTDFAFKPLAEMSGGERQRVFIARAMAQQPKILLLDEPTNNLDMRMQLDALQQIKRLVEDAGIICLLIIHDLNLTTMFCEQAVLMHQGELYANGKPVDVLTAETVQSVYGVQIESHYVDGVNHITLLHD